MPQAPPRSESLEEVLNAEILRMHEEVAEHPEGDFHFHHGLGAAEMFAYDPAWLERVPKGAVDSFAGVGNPHERAEIAEGETVVDLGCRAGMDSIIAAWRTGPGGRVVGVDMNPTMLAKAEAHAAYAGVAVEATPGRLEDIPMPGGSVDLVISNGAINLSYRKRRVMEEMFRVLKPGGRVSFTDIVSAKQLTQSIVNDPKLWAS